MKTSQPGNRHFYILGILAILLIQAPEFILWDQARIGIEDNLEPLVGFHAFAGKNAQFFGKTMPVMLGGLPHAAYSPEPYVIHLIYRMAPVLVAYTLNEFLIRLIGFIGMFTLTSAIRPGNRYLRLAIATCYAYLPYWTPGGASIAALPLLVWTAYTYQRRDASRGQLTLGFAILVLYPSYSLLANTGIFLVPLGGFFFLWSIVRRRAQSLRIGMGLFLLTASLFLNSLPLILNNLSADPIIWHRIEFRDVKLAGGVGREALYLLLKTHYHADAAPFPLVWILVLLGGWIVVAGRVSRRARMPEANFQQVADRRGDAWLLSLIGIIFAIAAIYFIYFDPYIFRARERIPLLAQLNLSRTYFFLPLLWYLAAAYASFRIWELRSPIRFAAPLLLCLHLVFLASHQSSLLNRPSEVDVVPVKPTAQHPLPGHDRFIDPGARPTFRAYKAEKLFDKAEARIREVESQIHRNQVRAGKDHQLVGQDRTTYWIACLGFYPSQAHLNNFRTVDGYWYLYPLERKYLWQRVMHPELSKSPEMQWRYNRWGSRAYLFSTELGHNYLIEKTSPIKAISDFRINTFSLSRLGAQYIFSTVRIRNAKGLNLLKIGFVEDPEACMNLYIYKIRARTRVEPSVIPPDPSNPGPFEAQISGVLPESSIESYRPIPRK